MPNIDIHSFLVFVCSLCLCVVSHAIDKLCVFFGSRIHRCARQLTQTNKTHGSAVMIRPSLYTSSHIVRLPRVYEQQTNTKSLYAQRHKIDTKHEKKDVILSTFRRFFHNIHQVYLQRLGRKGWLTSECVVCSHETHKKKKEEYCSVKHTLTHT